MSVPQPAMFSMQRFSHKPRGRSSAALLRLWAGLLLLPLAAIAQSNSTIDVETAPNVWGPCGNITQMGLVQEPLLSPPTPTAESPVMFRIRKTSLGTPSEIVRLDAVQFAPPFSEFRQSSASEVQFSSSPSLPFDHSSGGTRIFMMSMTPPDPGLYRFIFSSDLWDGGSCTVEIDVAEQIDCLIESVEGIDGGSPQDGLLDFGALPVGQVAVGTIRFNFFTTLPQGEGILASAFLDPPFEFDAESYAVSPSRDQATLDVIFAPVEAGEFSQTVQFYTDREEDNLECRLPMEFRGQGIGPEVSLTFGTPVCGDIVEIPVVLTNESSVVLQNLTASVPAGYSLLADPPGSFNVNSFSIGAAPAQRRFTLRLLQAQGSGQPFVMIEQQGELISRTAIPEISCIRIVEPTSLMLDFGDVAVSTEAPPQAIRLANRGNTLATVTATVRNGGVAAGFGVGAGGATSATVAILPGAEQVLAVAFVPPSVGPKQSVVDFTSTAISDIPSVSLSGNGVDQPRPMLSFLAGGAAVNPGGTIRFASTAVGQTSSAPLVITNNGNLGVLSLVVSASNGEFGVAGSAPPELAAGQSANYNLTFTPSQSGTRRGQLTVVGENLDAITFVLEGDAVMSQITVNSVGLSGTVTPAQTPAPTVGLQLAAGAASQTLEGDLLLEFTPNLPQSPPAGFAAAYQAVRFMAGTGAAGRTLRFRFEQGQQRAVFPGEQQAGSDPLLARFQSGTVAGSIQFRLANVQTLQGTPVPVANPIVGMTTVGRLAPSIRSMTTPQRTGGINVVVQAVSTTREITGVCLALTAASGTDLTFTRPDPAFLNTPFSQWFTNSNSFPHGGAFALTIPIDISDIQVFGGAQVWLRNGEGWSAANSPCGP